MDKAELGRRQLLDLLGSAGKRAADEVIADLTYCEAGFRPALPLATVIARPGEFRERLIAEAELTPADVAARAEAAPDDRHAYCLHSFALYLLALWNEPRAFQPIVAYLRSDPAMADEQLDDIVTEDLPAILARTYDGSDLDPLKAIVETPGGPPLLRSAALNGLLAMARLGKLNRQDVIAYVEALAVSLDQRANEDVMALFAMNLAALQEQRLRAVIESWFAAGWIDETRLAPADVDEIYAAGYDELNEDLVRRERFDGLIDYLCDWAWFNVGDPSELQPGDEDGLGVDFEGEDPPRSRKQD
jgi:hypothetical protein